MDKDTQVKLLKYKAYIESIAFSPSKKIKGKLALGLKWLIVKAGLFYTLPRKKKCDVLFLHTYETEAGRLTNLVSHLKEQKLSVVHITHSLAQAIKNRQLQKGTVYNSIDLTLYEAYVTYLIEKYTPKVFITLENSLIISPIIKEKIKPYGTYINISHGVTPNQHFHTMIDFDYYFLFGKSSLKNLLNNPVRFGNTRVVFTGSPYIDYQPRLNTAKINRIDKVLYFSAWLPAGEIGRILSDVLLLVVAWARQRPEVELTIKLHPLEEPEYVQKITENIKNIKILDKKTSMVDALEGIQIVFNQWSNASIEAALLGIPTVIVNPSDMADDYLHLESFFPKRAKSVEEITQRLAVIENNYEYYKTKTKEFFEYHLERADGSKCISEKILELYAKGSINNYIEITEHFNI